MTETEIDRWAAIYQANPHLAGAGIDFGALLDEPRLLFSSLPAPAREGPRALLPAQRRIATRMLRAEQIADAVRGLRRECEAALPLTARHTGGGFIEPLSHHAHQVNATRCRETRPHR